MIESILITNLNGGIIYSKYFKGTTAEIEEWERTLYKLTNESWNSAKNQKIELAVYGLVVGFFFFFLRQCKFSSCLMRILNDAVISTLFTLQSMSC
jgi:hypothetical protein